MDDRRTDLKTALRELAAGEVEALGPHLGWRSLLAYREGTLDAAEREALQEHLSRCGRCSDLLRELKDFEVAATGSGPRVPEPGKQEAWKSLLERLPHEAPPARPLAGPLPRAEPRRTPRWALAAAAALLLTLVGLSLWTATTLRQERRRLASLAQQIEERERSLAELRRTLAEAESRLGAANGDLAQQHVRVAELSAALEELRHAARAPEARDRPVLASRQVEVSVAPRLALRGQPQGTLLRAGGAVNPVRLPPGGEPLSLSLDLANHPHYGEYRLELLDRDGAVLWAVRRQAGAMLGDAGTTVAIGGLEPGRYRLRVEGARENGTDLLAEYVLEVEAK